MPKVKKTKSTTKKTSVHKVTSSSTSGGSLGSQMESFFTKSLPTFPDSVIEVLVKVAPWLAIIGVVLGLPAIFALFGLSRYAGLYGMMGAGMMGVRWGFSYQLGNIFLVANLILTGIAIPGLFNRDLSAWKLMYYSAWISLAENLLYGSILGGLLGAFISFYLLFQVRKSYR